MQPFRKTDLNIEKLNQWKQLEGKENMGRKLDVDTIRHVFVDHYFSVFGGS